MKRIILILGFLITAWAGYAQQQYSFQGNATGTDTYATSITNMTAYSSGSRGVVIHVFFDNANTGAATLNVTGTSGALGAIDIAGTSTPGTIGDNSIKTLAYNVVTGDFDIVGGGSGGSPGWNLSGNTTLTGPASITSTDPLSFVTTDDLVFQTTDSITLNFNKLLLSGVQNDDTIDSVMVINGDGSVYWRDASTLGGVGDVTYADLMTSRTLTGADDLDQTDNLRIVYANSASPFDITVDLLTAGSQVTVINIGSATVTLIEGSGVTLPGTTVDIAAGENAVIIYRVAATPEVYTGAAGGGSGTVDTGTAGQIAVYSASTTVDGATTGTGVVTALGVNTGSAGAFVVNGGALGTPSSGTLTNATGLPVTGLSGSWSNLTSTLTGTAPYVPLTGSAALTGNVELTGAHKIGLSNSAASLGIGVAPGSITANTAFEIVSGNDTHAIFRNSSTPANNIQFGVLSGITPQAMFTVGVNNTKMYQSGSSFRTEASGTLIYYASTTTFQNAASTFGIQNSPNANVDNAVIPFSIFAGGVSTSAATQAMGGDLYFKGRFWNGSANVSRGFYFHPQASTSNNLEGNLRLYTDIAGGTSVEIMRFDQAGNANVATNLHIGSTSVTNASAVAEVSSTTKGFLPPRMTTTQKNAISSPAAGLMVFDTDLAKMCFYNGSAWETITSAP